jgi:hypothetical protein
VAIVPKVIKELGPEDFKSNSQGIPNSSILEPYLHMLTPVEVGYGLEVELEEGDEQRVVKRRFTTAGKQLGKNIKWLPSDPGRVTLRVLPPKAEDPAAVPGRKRGPKPKIAQPPAEPEPAEEPSPESDALAQYLGRQR